MKMKVKEFEKMMSISWNGNKKLPYATWNVPARVTCPRSTALCRARCYGVKAEIMYPNCLPSRMRNYAIARSDGFADLVTGYIRAKKNPPSIFRIHESGDFFSKEYFRAWIKIAKDSPSIQFYAFTKVYNLFRFKRPENLVLIASVFPDEKRKAPKNAPVFQTVEKGKTGQGQRCHGGCDGCGICPYASPSTRVWCEMH